jgi:hypothetical protein
MHDCPCISLAVTTAGALFHVSSVTDIFWVPLAAGIFLELWQAIKAVKIIEALQALQALQAIKADTPRQVSMTPAIVKCVELECAVSSPGLVGNEC